MEPNKKLKEQLQKHIDKTPIKFNPNNQLTKITLTKHLKNKKKQKNIYCPYQRVTGDKNLNKEITCPCVFHRDKIKLQGHYHCNLFVAE